MSQVNGLALGSATIGAVLLYSALKGKTVLGTVQQVIKGQAPATAPAGGTIPIATEIASAAAAASGSVTLGSGGQPVANTGSAQAILQQTAAQFGWGSGPEWQALQTLELHEASFNPHAKNVSSGAFGLAQAYGHGSAATQGTESDMYGGFGLSDAQAKLANSGDAAMQSLWMCNYIKQTYGSPSKAWAQYYNHAGGVGSY
jgi:hypothetical protein